MAVDGLRCCGGCFFFFFFAVTSDDFFFNGFAPVGFESAAWADGFLVPWLWLLMG